MSLDLTGYKKYRDDIYYDINITITDFESLDSIGSYIIECFDHCTDEVLENEFKSFGYDDYKELLKMKQSNELTLTITDSPYLYKNWKLIEISIKNFKDIKILLSWSYRLNPLGPRLKFEFYEKEMLNGIRIQF